MFTPRFLYDFEWFLLPFVSLFIIWYTIDAKAMVSDEKEYIEIAEMMRNEALLFEGTYIILEKILESGPRFAGSPGYTAAVDITQRIMEDLGFDKVWLEPVSVPRWIRGEPEKANIVNSERLGTVPLSVLALGGSVSTPKGGIVSEVIEVQDFEQLREIGEKARGKIAFFNRPMDRRNVNTFAAYSGAVNQRSRGAIEAGRFGAIAVLVRSMTTQIDTYPHTGMMRYDDTVPKIPAAAISTFHADLLSEELLHNPDLNVFLEINAFASSPVINYNVMGELSGYQYPNEIIVVACHLDTWDVSVGAHDNGAGCAQAISAIKLLKDLGLRPKRTVRAVLYANEEFGVSGGREYVQSENRKNEKHIAAMESDRGGFLPLGFTIDSSTEVVDYLQRYSYLFSPLQMHTIVQGYGGVDITPLKEYGTLTIGLLVDSQRYFDIHHSEKDTIDKVNPRELELGTIGMALLAYVLSEEGIPDWLAKDSLSN
jgi:carboxypeptidase Q